MFVTVNYFTTVRDCVNHVKAPICTLMGLGLSRFGFCHGKREIQCAGVDSDGLGCQILNPGSVQDS